MKIKGLCKIVSLDDVKNNDYSLTPGRYVGHSIRSNNEIDYKNRISQIQNELENLNIESVKLMNEIKKFKL